MRVIDALRAISLYPINPKTAEVICTECGLMPSAEATNIMVASAAYKIAKAKVYIYLAEAPAVTEGGATYSFTEDERTAFRKKAISLLEAAGAAEDDGNTIEVGWIGEEL